MKKTMSRFKWYWSGQEARHEAWLREMALRGFHLCKTHWYGRHVFHIAAPADMVYRLDASANADKPAYRHLLEDAGWTLIDQTMGFHIWSHTAEGNKPLEIFSDPASKIAHYKHMLGICVISLFGMLACAPWNLDKLPALIRPLSMFMLLVIPPVALLTVVQIYLLWQRIRALRQNTV